MYNIYNMRSLRLKVTLLNVIAVTVAILVATVIGVLSIASFGHESSEQSLRLLCQEGKNNLTDYFDSIEQSAETVTDLIQDDLADVNLTDLTDHVTRADHFFKNAIKHTQGVATYYYRFDPDVTNEGGFWYVDSDDGQGLQPHAVTDITANECPWFYGPKQDGHADWLLPYKTDSLDDYTVLSYNVPVYKGETFVGVVGIELKYATIGAQISELKALDTGFAFVIENVDGKIIWHPTEELFAAGVPEAFIKALRNKPLDKNGGRHIEYSFKGVRKHSYVMPFGNDKMSVAVCVPLSEVNALWLKVVIQIIIAALVVIAITIVVGIIFARQLTKPLHDLTVAAQEINKGNYDVKLNYKGNDEMGVLTKTVNNLIDNLGGYISDLNALAYADALTSVRNRGAYEIVMRELQKKIDEGEEPVFAIALFDCDYLKNVNDAHGHDKGNVYLRNSCNLICRIFEHSVVYRIGGDEFVAILQGEDFDNREKLKKQFIAKSAEICAFAKDDYEKIRVSVGIAVYDPKIDKTVEDVAIHADHLMYENKRERKAKK